METKEYKREIYLCKNHLREKRDKRPQIKIELQIERLNR